MIAGISVYVWFCIGVTLLVLLLCIAAVIQVIVDPQPSRREG